MKMDFRLEEWLPPIEGAHLGIAIVGAGQVVNGAHLPAYRKGRLSVAGIFDRDRAKAEATAGRFGVEKVYGSLEELLDDPAVDIVDVAVPGVEQKTIALAAAGQGKHLLCQKPLAASVDDGREIVAAAKANGVQLAVNMNGRWDPALRAAKSLIEDEFMGAPRFVRFEVSGGGWPSTGWISAGRHMAILYNIIHCIDALRYCFGEPERVSATDISFPDEAPPGDRMAIITMEFPEHLGAGHPGLLQIGVAAEMVLPVRGNGGSHRGRAGVARVSEPASKHVEARVSAMGLDLGGAEAGRMLAAGRVAGDDDGATAGGGYGPAGAQQRGRQPEDAGAGVRDIRCDRSAAGGGAGRRSGSRAAEDQAARRKSDPLVAGLVRVWLMPPTPPLDSGPVSGYGACFRRSDELGLPRRPIFVPTRKSSNGLNTGPQDPKMPAILLPKMLLCQRQ